MWRTGGDSGRRENRPKTGFFEAFFEQRVRGLESGRSANSHSLSEKTLHVVRVVWFTSGSMKSHLGALAAVLFGAALTLSRAEDIKTVTGEEYKNVKISRVEPDGLVIIASYGIIKILSQNSRLNSSRSITTTQKLRRPIGTRSTMPKLYASNQ